MSKCRKVITAVAVILAVIIAFPLYMGISAGLLMPTVRFDAESLTGEVTNGASGYLYGIAEDGVPSHNMVESLDVSSVSAKTQGGLQHPIGEVGDVAPSLLRTGHCDYIVVYLQDMFSTWYYEDANITEMKKNGTYDWKEFLTGTYFPLVEQSINEMKDTDYADKLVYCIFNECDNGVWFGEWVKDGENGWNDWNEQGRKNFYEAWKMTYDYVRKLDPDAVIGGPGYYEYSSWKTDEFLKFTSENNCNPDVIIYHELGDRSIYDWEANVKDLYSIEEKYSVSTGTPIIITEYGRMQDNGNPCTMLKYIVRTENTKVYSNQAYWLFADNLCSTCADYNTPNSAWWVYRWYTSMQGQTMSSEIDDILHSDLGKAVKEKRELRYQQFMGLGTITDEKDNLSILVSGADYKGRVLVENLKDTALYGKDVEVKVEAVTYQGILGKVYEPEIVKIYSEKCGKNLSVSLDMDDDTAYRITVTPAVMTEDFENDNLWVRFEAEHGTLLGDAYTYDSAYATTGEVNGMVGGMEKEGDGVEIKINVPEDGHYQFRIIYGKANDGQTSADRVSAEVKFTLDGEESVLLLPNTIRSEITGTLDLEKELTKGEHTLKFSHKNGTSVLDSVLVRKAEERTSVYFEEDDDRENSYLAVAPYDGYFTLFTSSEGMYDIDGAQVNIESDDTAVYLRRGINYIQAPEKLLLNILVTDKKGQSIVLETDSAVLSEGAEVKKNDFAGISYITGISSEGGKAEYKINAPEKGTYKLTIAYSNNRENGVHSYNVDLVEDFITISVNGEKSENLYCRNTYSHDTYTTVTTNISLEKGENILTFSNDGANKFNNGTTFAPDISTVFVNAVSVN
ncbi:MAG: hypothetical protein IJ289_07080 [Clostridia bacterium]|nr:hypothetical protein [Clostridia bacterium]